MNGVPFLLIQGSNTDYGWWRAAGYTRAQADAKLAQMAQSGFNTNYTPWKTMDTFWPGGDPTVHQDELLWQKFGLYANGVSRGDETTEGVDYSIPSNPALVAIINKFKTRPNLLAWTIDGEWDPGKVTAAQYCTGYNTVRGTDPTRVTSDWILQGLSLATWESILGSCLQLAFPEVSIAYVDTNPPFRVTGTASQFVQLHDELVTLNQAWTRGKRFVLGISTTPITEVDNFGSTLISCTDYYNKMSARLPTLTELHRYYMYQVANNTRAFDMLWAVNQRCGGVPLGDNLDPKYLTSWNDTLTELSRVRSLKSVILAPGRWQPLATTPAFVPYAYVNDFRGIFAAKKTVAGKTYVIAINADFTEDPVDIYLWTEHPIFSAKIDVAGPIGSVTRLFESAGPPSFSGSVITDSFVPMGVHVYVVQ